MFFKETFLDISRKEYEEEFRKAAENILISNGVIPDPSIEEDGWYEFEPHPPTNWYLYK